MQDYVALTDTLMMYAYNDVLSPAVPQSFNMYLNFTSPT